MAKITQTSETHSTPPAGEAAAPERYRIKLIKGQQRWQFRWNPGSEAALIERIAQLAATPDSQLDWYDAAVICRHIAQPYRTSSVNSTSGQASGA
jgi:hypothetical protein